MNIPFQLKKVPDVLNNPIGHTDSYKISHKAMEVQGTIEIYSNLTARNSDYFKKVYPEHDGKVVFFGLTFFLLRELVEKWNTYFFNRPAEEAVPEFIAICAPYIGLTDDKADHFYELHALGHLPLRIKALPEGTVVDTGIPLLTVVNTHSSFSWLTNYIESTLSAEVWKPINVATIAREFAKLRNKYWDQTVVDHTLKGYAIHDFSYRGQDAVEVTSIVGAAPLIYSSGTDNIPGLIVARTVYGGDENTAHSVPACYPEGTEILTDSGFKDFRELEEQDLIAQYSEDGSILFSKNSEYHEYEYDGLLYNYSTPDKVSINLSVTDNHKMVARSKGGNIITGEAKDFNYSSNKAVIVSGLTASTKYTQLTPYERLLIAFQADGSYSNRQGEYNGLRTGTIPLRFSLKKLRKKERLVQILEDCGFEYTLTQHSDDYYSIRCNVPINERISKTFDWVELDQISSTWCKEFVEEVSYWDGSKGKDKFISYTSIIKENVDTLAAICVLGGIKVLTRVYNDPRVNRKPLYCLHSQVDTTQLCGSKVTKETVPYKGKVYCVTVDTGMIIVRQNGRVIVSGNCEHSVTTLGINWFASVTQHLPEVKAMIDQLKDKLDELGLSDEFDQAKGELLTIYRLLTEVYPTGLLSYVADSYDFWRVITILLPILKPVIMAREGKLVVRPDSGNPADIVCGSINPLEVLDLPEFEEDVKSILINALIKETEFARQGPSEYSSYFKDKTGNVFKGTVTGVEWDRFDKRFYYVSEDQRSAVVTTTPVDLDCVQKGAIETLYDIFGGTINAKGYKELDPHIGLIYGDGITYDRATDIYKRLTLKGFAVSNVVLGVGSFTFANGNGSLSRDSLSIAIKATSAIVDKQRIPLFKNPKTDVAKKSAVGLLCVNRNEEGNFVVEHDVTPEKEDSGELVLVFENGQIYNVPSFEQIRQNAKLS